MLCPKCESKTKIWDTRTFKDASNNFTWVQRKHGCFTCEELFFSIEVTMETWVAMTAPKENATESTT